MTVAQLMQRWHDDVIRHQVVRSTADNYKSVSDHHIVPALGRKRLKELTPGDIDRLMAQKMDSGLSVSTVRRIRSVLAQALTQAIRWGSVNRNVASLTRGPEADPQGGPDADPEQGQEPPGVASGPSQRGAVLADALDGHVGRRHGRAGLRWDDVDLDDGCSSVQGELKREGGQLTVADTKTAKSRRAVNLPAPMIGVLKAHRARQAQERLRLGRGLDRHRSRLHEHPSARRSTRGTFIETSRGSAGTPGSGTGIPTSFVTRRRA